MAERSVAEGADDGLLAGAERPAAEEAGGGLPVVAERPAAEEAGDGLLAATGLVAPGGLWAGIPEAELAAFAQDAPQVDVEASGPLIIRVDALSTDVREGRGTVIFPGAGGASSRPARHPSPDPVIPAAAEVTMSVTGVGAERFRTSSTGPRRGRS